MLIPERARGVMTLGHDRVFFLQMNPKLTFSLPLIGSMFIVGGMCEIRIPVPLEVWEGTKGSRWWLPVKEVSGLLDLIVCACGRVSFAALEH